MQIDVYVRRTGEFVDSQNRVIAERPYVTAETLTSITLGLFGTASATAITSIADYASWECVISDTYGDKENVKIRISTGVTVTGGKPTISFGNLSSTELTKMLGTLPYKDTMLELSGFAAGSTAPDFCIQFPLIVRNRIGGGSTTPQPTAGYMTEAQVRALIAEVTNVQSDWDQTDSTKMDYIKNKPTIPTVPVQSVNGQTGAVVLTAGSVGAMAEVTGGTAGQVLTKTADGMEWQNPSEGNVIRLAECSGLGFTTSSDGPHFSWIDPDNVVLNSSILAEWNQTDLVRKQGSSYPTDHTDGTVVATTSVALANKNYYRDHEFIDTTQVSGGTYSYKLFSQTGSGAWNNLAANEFSSGLGLSWAQVALYVKAGYGPTLWPVGTVFIVPHEEYQSTGYEGIAFRVAGHDQVPAADESLTHTMCLEMDDVLFSSQYDSPELLYALTADTTAQANKTYYKYENSTYTALVEGTDYDVGDPVPAVSWYEKNNQDRANYGSNYFPFSNELQWANSSGNANSWFTPKNLWDQCTSAFKSKNGFLKHLDENFLAVVKPAKLITNRANVDGGEQVTTTDARFWPLSMTQVFGSSTENVRLQYYANGGSAVKKPIGSTSATSWWLRSPNAGSASSVYGVTASGASGDYNAYNTRGVALACIIA